MIILQSDIFRKNNSQRQHLSFQTKFSFVWPLHLRKNCNQIRRTSVLTRRAARWGHRGWPARCQWRRWPWGRILRDLARWARWQSDLWPSPCRLSSGAAGPGAGLKHTQMAHSCGAGTWWRPCWASHGGTGWRFLAPFMNVACDSWGQTFAWKWLVCGDSVHGQASVLSKALPCWAPNNC